MGTLVFQANLGGAVNLIGPNTASTVNFTLPSADGTSGQALVTNGSGTLSFSTFTSGAAGSNTQVQFNSSGAFAGSANLTFDGTTLTSNALTVTNATTLSAGTANGVAYLNGSKVLTTGSALTFDGSNFATTGKAHIGSITGSNYQLFSYQNASTGSSAAFVVRQDGTDPIAVFQGAAGSEQMRLTSTGLGIGTSSPLEKLQVNGAILTTGSLSAVRTSAASLDFLSGNTRFISMGADASTKGGFIWYNSTNAAVTEGMRLDTSGNLGLGGTSSSSGITIAKQYGGVNITGGGGTYAQWGGGYGMFPLAGVGLGIASQAAMTFLVNNTSTQAMTLDASGNLGIGTTSPSVILDVQSASPIVKATATTGTNTASFRVVNTGGTSYFARDSSTGGFTGTAYATFVWGSGAYPMVFATNDIERARIDSSGNFMVGQTSTNRRFAATHNVANYTAEISNSNGTPYGIYVLYSGAAPNNTGSQFFTAVDTGGTRFDVRSNGGLANYSANDVNLSDRREKTNFAPAGEYLSKICAIPVQTFNYIDQNLEEDAGLTLGVVAQDVQAVAPELVMESNWGTEEEPKMRLSIYQTDVQYALMKCIQEQQAIIEQLKARLDAANL